MNIPCVRSSIDLFVDWGPVRFACDLILSRHTLYSSNYSRLNIGRGFLSCTFDLHRQIALLNPFFNPPGLHETQVRIS